MPAIRPGVIHKILLAFFRKCCYNSNSPISDFIKKGGRLCIKSCNGYATATTTFGSAQTPSMNAGPNKSHGLNNNLLLTLYLLKEFPNDCTQHLICEKLMLPKQTVNSILSGLEDKGFVEKIISPTDKRVKLLVFTSQGAAYADGLLQKMDDFEERALRNMTDAQRNALLEGGFAWMKALRDAIDD